MLIGFSINEGLFLATLATGAYRASQGHAVGADGLVYCRQEADGSIWIGGMVRSVASSALLHRPI